MSAKRYRTRALGLERLEDRQLLTRVASIPALPPPELKAGSLVCTPTSRATLLETRTGTNAATSTTYTLNARDFGAKGDGRSNDTQALQTAIYAAAHAGYKLSVPAGTYLVSKSGPAQVLVLPSNLVLVGAGVGKTVFKLAAGQGDFLPVFSAKGASNLSLRDFSVDGNRANQAAPTAEHSPGIWLEGGAQIALSRVELKNAQGDGILIRGGAENVVLDQCRITGNFREALALGTGYRNITLSNSYADGPVHSEPEAEVPCENVTLLNNTLRGSLYAISLGGRSPTAPSRGWRIEGNTIYGAVSIVWAEDVVISGNNITGSALPDSQARPTIYGVYYSRNVQLNNNRIRGLSRDVIYVGAAGGQAPQDWTIRSNTLLVPPGRQPFVNKGGVNILYQTNAVSY